MRRPTDRNDRDSDPPRPSTRAHAGKRPKPIEQRRLARDDLLPRRLEIEPLGAIDLGEGLLAPAARRPLHVEAVAADAAHVQIALDGETDNALAGFLRDLAERLKLACRGDAELLRELAARRGRRLLAGAELTL